MVGEGTDCSTVWTGMEEVTVESFQTMAAAASFCAMARFSLRYDGVDGDGGGDGGVVLDDGGGGFFLLYVPTPLPLLSST